jgi:acetyl-CoA carboxylase carboxyl transferase subunit beta
MARFTTSAMPSNADSSGLWVTCPNCTRILRDRDAATTLRVCSSCGHHLRLDAAARLRTLLDLGRWTEHDARLASADPLAFTDQTPYPTRLQEGSAITGLRDAVIAATGTIEGLIVEVIAMDFGFIGGSLGIVGGEKIARAADRALAQRRPLVVVCASSGARVMEGTLSLVQMAKVSAALGSLDRARVPYVTVLTDPTTGAVAASLAMLADVIIAEPGARIGFAGPQVIERSGGRLPQGFQRSEYLLEHGMVDMVVDRRELTPTLARLLRFLGATSAVTEAGPATSSDARAGVSAPSPLDLPLD